MDYQQDDDVHRTIMAVDVEGFSDKGRNNRYQKSVRKGLYRSLARAFNNAGLSWDACHIEDRGDGVFILVPPEIPKARFVTTVPHEVAAALREHNSTRRVEERIRLRMALNAGEVAFDEHGVTAASINLTFRLLNAQPLKDALRDSPGALVLITSGWFFDEVVRNSHPEPSTFRLVRVAVKETDTVAWINRPDHSYPPDPTYLMAPPDDITISSPESPQLPTKPAVSELASSRRSASSSSAGSQHPSSRLHYEVSGTLVGSGVQAGVVRGGVHFHGHHTSPSTSASRVFPVRKWLQHTLLGIASILVIDLVVPASGPSNAADAESCVNVALDAPQAVVPSAMESTGAFLWHDQFHLFAPSFDGRLRHWRHGPPNLNSHLEGYQGLGITGRPAAFVDDFWQHIFARSVDGGLLHMFWDAMSSRWFRDTWADDLSGDPTALLDGPNQNVWAVNHASELIRVWWNSEEKKFHREIWGQSARGRPSVTMAANTLHLVARSSSGAILYWRSDRNQPLQITRFGGGITGDPIIAVVDNLIHVWAVGGQQQLWHWWLEENDPWRGEIWGTGVVGRPSVVLIGRLPRVFTRSATGTLERWSADDSAVVRREYLGGDALTDPTATWFYGQEHVFTTTQRDIVQHWWSTTACAWQLELLL